MKPQLRHVESFHLSLLRILEARLNRANWVVKGGVNLRAWFGSRRYSEDMDVDVVECPQHVLRERFDKVLASRPGEMLTTQGLEVTRISRPKQTDTTQRWKIELKAAGVSLPLHTRVEFSGVERETRSMRWSRFGPTSSVPTGSPRHGQPLHGPVRDTPEDPGARRPLRDPGTGRLGPGSPHAHDPCGPPPSSAR